MWNRSLNQNQREVDVETEKKWGGDESRERERGRGGYAKQRAADGNTKLALLAPNEHHREWVLR